jgi:hypothetical protein
MKIKTNIRAGRKSSTRINNTVSSYVAPVSRCAGV